MTTLSLSKPEIGSASAPVTGANLREVGHVASLDGLRALAILAVMLGHVGVPGLTLAWLGVDLFFVLSGFLITTLLIQEVGRTGRVAPGKFWARRFLRLMPAYWLYAGFITLAVGVIHWGWVREWNGWDSRDLLASIWLYYANYAPQAGVWEHQGLTGPLWSLAVEEQFYLIWPILFASLCRQLKRVEWLAWTLVGVIFVTCLMVEPRLLHFRLYTRGLGIMLGCAMALSSARSSKLVQGLGRSAVRTSVVILGVLSVAVPSWLLDRGSIDDTAMHRFFLPIFLVSMTLLVTLLWHGPRNRLNSLLSWQPMAYLGKISYGLYLYHMMAHDLVWKGLLAGFDHWPKFLRFGLRTALFLALSVGLASLSYHLWEKPFLAWKSRLRAS